MGSPSANALYGFFPIVNRRRRSTLRQEYEEEDAENDVDKRADEWMNERTEEELDAWKNGRRVKRNSTPSFVSAPRTPVTMTPRTTVVMAPNDPKRTSMAIPMDKFKEEEEKITRSIDSSIIESRKEERENNEKEKLETSATKGFRVPTQEDKGIKVQEDRERMKGKRKEGGV